MNRVIGILIALGVLFTGCDPMEDRNALAERTIQSVEAEFIPDGRLAIWEVEIERRGDWVLSGVTNVPEAKARLLEELDLLPYEVLDSLKVVKPVYGLVINSVGNLRSQPRHSAELSTQAVMGTPLKVYDQVENWYRVQTPDGYLGWMNEREFVAPGREAFESWQESDRVIFTPPEGGSLRVRPLAAQPVVSDLVMGAVLEVVDQNLLHYQVRLPDGRSGWINKTAAEPFRAWAESVVINPEEVIEIASAWMGRPYLWGGTSGKGVDCSGYTKSIFFQQGVILLRDASQQVRQGQEIATDTTWKNLMPGDFLFFGRPASQDQGERVTHVALYLGDGKIIHATGRVKVESLNPEDPDFAADRYDTFLRARRMQEDSSLLRVLDSWYF